MGMGNFAKPMDSDRDVFQKPWASMDSGMDYFTNLLKPIDFGGATSALNRHEADACKAFVQLKSMHFRFGPKIA